jgi:uncharacterized coiled-coil protein SlyX
MSEEILQSELDAAKTRVAALELELASAKTEISMMSKVIIKYHGIVSNYRDIAAHSLEELEALQKQLAEKPT